MERPKIGSDEITLQSAAGGCSIYLEDERIVAGPGSVTHIPGGAAHTVRNESATEARAYVIFSPGTEMEAFVRAVAENPEDVVALAEANGIEFTGIGRLIK
jgi:hypothetical protein